MHYWGKDIDDDDDEKDMSLPFKKSTANNHFQVVVPIGKIPLLKQHVALRPPCRRFCSESYFPNPALSSLFRPPRVLG